jgi:hypothetical protein
MWKSGSGTALRVAAFPYREGCTLLSVIVAAFQNKNRENRFPDRLWLEAEGCSLAPGMLTKPWLWSRRATGRRNHGRSNGAGF